MLQLSTSSLIPDQVCDNCRQLGIFCDNSELPCAFCYAYHVDCRITFASTSQRQANPWVHGSRGIGIPDPSAPCSPPTMPMQLQVPHDSQPAHTHFGSPERETPSAPIDNSQSLQSYDQTPHSQSYSQEDLSQSLRSLDPEPLIINPTDNGPHQSVFDLAPQASTTPALGSSGLTPTNPIGSVGYQFTTPQTTQSFGHRSTRACDRCNHVKVCSPSNSTPIDHS